MNYGVGLDCGTMNFVACRQESSSDLETTFRKLRNTFITLEKDKKKSLNLMKGKKDFVERENDIVVLGDGALDIANVFGKEVRRPLSSGLLNSGEKESQEILATMIKYILREPRIPRECCYYSVPAVPVDNPNHDIVYHTEILRQIITKCGYNAVPSNEAASIVFAECGDDSYNGIGCSFGSGMSNVSLVYSALEVHSFSIQKGGDYIDQQAAQSTGLSPVRICSMKEREGIDLFAPQGREQQAIAIYYENLIREAVHHMVKEFNRVKDKYYIAESIPLVISGGTSKAKGFREMFQKALEAEKVGLPFKISEIRQSDKPLNAVAKGLFIQAVQEHLADE